MKKEHGEILHFLKRQITGVADMVVWVDSKDYVEMVCVGLEGDPPTILMFVALGAFLVVGMGERTNTHVLSDYCIETIGECLAPYMECLKQVHCA